jgi:outer membrane receptor for ferrienterochelin and colicins
MKLFKILLFLLIFGQANAQTLFKVVDKTTMAPVPYANICIESLNGKEKSYSTSDEKGETLKFLGEKAIIAVSSTGYLTEIDTIQTIQQCIIYLTPSASDLDEVVVTASSRPKTRDKSIYKIEMISSSQIKDRAATNMSDLLSSQVSLRVEQNGSLGSSVRMQGLSGEQVKILIDGVPVVGRVNGNIDLSQLNLNNVDHVEIIEGPMSVLYGSDAMGGVINIITRDYSKKPIAITSQVYYESIGRYNAAFAISLYKNRHSLNLSGSRDFFSGASLPGDLTRVQSWKPRLQYTFEGAYTYTTRYHKLKFSSSFYNEEFRILGTPRPDSIYKISGDNIFLNLIASDAYNFTRRTSNRAEYTFHRDKNTFDLVSAYSTFRRILNTYSNDLTSLHKTLDGVAGQDTQRIESIMTKGIWSNTYFEHLETFGGLDFNFDHAQDKADFGNKEMTDIAAFLNMQYSPNEVISFQPGARLIYNSRFPAPLVYSFNFKYAPAKQLAIRLSYAKGFRSPSLKELFFNFTELEHDVHGNPDLKAEYSHNVSASADYRTKAGAGNIRMNLSLFFNQLKNKIDYLTDPTNPLKATLINLPLNNYRNFGTNVLASYQYSEFSIESGMDLTAVSTLENTSSFNYSQNYIGNLIYSFPSKKLRFTANYKYNGRFILYVAEKQENGQLNVSKETLANGYHNLDAQLSRLILHDKIDVGIGVKNMFNNTLVKASANSSGGSTSGLVGWGRTYFVKMNFNLDKW